LKTNPPPKINKFLICVSPSTELFCSLSLEQGRHESEFSISKAVFAVGLEQIGPILVIFDMSPSDYYWNIRTFYALDCHLGCYFSPLWDMHNTKEIYC
jgi:hypothetical protein